ncbi:MAG TPA: hypothetical protein VFK23_04115, partial [Nitrospirota bacterium]|nr:hypothetical protein [Nitrospirota bacterium]
RGVYQVPKNEMRISSDAGRSLNNTGRTAFPVVLEVVAMAFSAHPAMANPPRANPESFNASRRVNPLDIVFLVVFMISCPSVIGLA